jgi:GxxExxY protein
MQAPENPVSREIVDAAIKVHRAWGPGLLEWVYVAALACVLRRRGCRVCREVPIHAVFEGEDLGVGHRADLVVNDLVIVEVKSVASVAEVHRKQLLTYLKISGFRLGLLVNFNEARMRTGIARVVNGLPES